MTGLDQRTSYARAGPAAGAGAGPDAGSRPHAELEALAARFRAIVERCVDGIVVIGPDGRILFTNPSAQELLGRNGDDLLGGTFDFPAVPGETTEIEIVRAGGETVVAEMRAAETTWEGQDALLVLIRDVTDRKAAEQRERELIREQAARARAESDARRAELLDRANRALGSTLDLDELLATLAVILADELGDLCLVELDDASAGIRRFAAAGADSAFPAVLRTRDRSLLLPRPETMEARVFRVASSELVGRITDDWIEDASDRSDWAHLCRTIKPSSLMRISLTVDDEPWGGVTVFARDPEEPQQPADLQLATEIVRRAAIAAENARLYRFAQQANRAKSDFLAVVSHELRTPLSGILGYASLLADGIAGELSPRQREHVESVRTITEHLARLIEQLLVFARVDRGDEAVSRDETDAARIAGDVATLAATLARDKDLALRVDVPDGPVPMVTDEKKLAQVLINLITNAIKYTKSGEVRLAVVPEAGDVEFRVEDTGVGIEEDRLEEIFLPFHQLEDPRTRAATGTGIGLSLVKDLAELLGGGVSVESTVGRGSTFTVRVPRTLPAEPVLSPA